MRTWSYAKGHGTKNDFVLVLDRNNLLNPSAADIAFVCDRRAGIGADGILRAVWAANVPEWDGPTNLWFMDYRNADGSVAETCGNGLRVFAAWLAEEDLVTGNVIPIGTRSGLRRAVVLPGGRVAVTMGTPTWDPTPTTVMYSGRTWTGHPVAVGNPHLVVRVDSAADLAGLDLSARPELDPTVFPAGANVEFVAAMAENRLVMRVHERGVGETMSCGSGVVAAALDAARQAVAAHTTYQVEVPGGVLKVTFDADEAATLTGPAVIVAHGEVSVPDD